MCWKNKLAWSALLASAVLPLATSQAAQPGQAWKDMAQGDLDFIRQELNTLYISAVFPDAPAFQKRIAASYDVARQEVAQVKDFGGYRAVLNHFVYSMHDAHVGLSFRLSQTSNAWPGFMAVYQGRRFLTTASGDPAIAAGQEITECDGMPMAEWSRRVATYEGGFPGLGRTHVAMARAIFVDRGNPFVARPSQCTIGGRPVALAWRPIAASDYSARVAAQPTTRNREASIAPFGEDGAWVRMGYFYPADKQEADAFHRLIADAALLRQKRVVVLDVRGNGGGNYGWFMGLLRGLYGQPYADHFARARLAIVPVTRAHERVVALYEQYRSLEDTLGSPPDNGTEWDPEHKGLRRAAAAGSPYFQPAGAPPAAPAGPAPGNPVHAKVYVLTDYSCGSACIAFVDEMKRFPGVTQIGVDTSVDSRTGTPMNIDLPSGNGELTLAVMTRPGRERDDNAPQRPAHEFFGDIRDTAAVQRWIQAEVRVKDGVAP